MGRTRARSAIGLQGPSRQHLDGTTCRDARVRARDPYRARISLQVGGRRRMIGLAIGGTSAACRAAFGGRVDG